MKRKGQHFLLSAKARSFSIVEIFRLSDDEAFQLFKESRWSDTDGKPVCTRCGVVDNCSWLRTRKQWRCKDCNYTFSVTSGTIFANHKLPLRVYLAAIALYSNAAKGLSSLQMSRDLNVQYKTAFVLMHKLRESLQDKRHDKLEGEIEMDAAYVNGHVRPINRIENRKDLRLAKHRNPKKRAVITMRQRGNPGEGANKTLSFVAKSENQTTIKKLADNHIATGSTVFADEHSAYNVLHGQFPTMRVNHRSIYSGPNGENTNQAESFFSRFRRMHLGQVHKMGNLYLDRYANEIAYREDTRRRSNGDIFSDIVGRCAQSPVSKDLCGYWQGNKPAKENLMI